MELKTRFLLPKLRSYDKQGRPRVAFILKNQRQGQQREREETIEWSRSEGCVV